MKWLTDMFKKKTYEPWNFSSTTPVDEERLRLLNERVHSVEHRVSNAERLIGSQVKNIVRDRNA